MTLTGNEKRKHLCREMNLFFVICNNGLSQVPMVFLALDPSSLTVACCQRCGLLVAHMKFVLKRLVLSLSDRDALLSSIIFHWNPQAFVGSVNSRVN